MSSLLSMCGRFCFTAASGHSGDNTWNRGGWQSTYYSTLKNNYLEICGIYSLSEKCHSVRQGFLVSTSTRDGLEVADKMKKLVCHRMQIVLPKTFSNINFHEYFSCYLLSQWLKAHGAKKQYTPFRIRSIGIFTGPRPAACYIRPFPLHVPDHCSWKYAHYSGHHLRCQPAHTHVFLSL